MQTKITLGQFLPGSSIIHRLDPRTKILLMVGYIVLVFMIGSLWAFIIPASVVAVCYILSQIPLNYAFSSLKPIRWLLVFMFVINLFFTSGQTVLLQFWIIRITTEALRQAVFITVRLLLLVIGTSVLTLTTSPLALTDGIEKLFQPLSVLKFPVHELAMMMSIALRFIPTLMEEVDRIQKAQTARGADFVTGSLIERAKNMIPILIPLFVSAFRRADELATAMESRCYHGGEGRTKMHELKMHTPDFIALILMACILAGTILIKGGTIL